jgi:hypothetical protein
MAIADSAVRFKQYGRGGVAAKITVSMHNEEWRLSRYAMHFEIDEQDVIDFQSLDTLRIMLDRMGADSRALVPDLVYSALLKNPTLEDELPLFDVGRSNLATGGGSAFGDTALDTGIGAIGSQLLYDHRNDPIHVNLAANYLLVPPTKLGLAKRLVRNMATGSGDLIVRPESRLLDVGIVDPQTDSKIAGNGTNWLLAAGSQQAPSVLLGFLDGNNQPVTRVSRITQGSWGMSIDIVFDVGVSVVDGRPLYWATGQ